MKRRWLFAVVVLLVGATFRTGAAEPVVLDVNFQGTSLKLALSFLAAKLEEKTGKTMNVVLIDPEKTLAEKPVSLQLTAVPWSEALRYTCDLAGASWHREGNVLLVGERDAVGRLQMQRSKILTGSGSSANSARLANLQVGKVAFADATLAEVADFLRDLGGELSKEKGIDLPFNVLIKESLTAAVATRTIDLALEDVSMAEVLHYATGLADCRFRIDARAVVIGEHGDLARPPGGPRNPAGPIFQQLAAKRIDAIDIPAGTKVEDFLDAVRTLGGVNGISLASDAVAASRVAMKGVTVLELVRYFNEASGTAYRLDPNAFVITDDPAVPKKPKPPEALVRKAPAGGDASGLGFDP